MSYASQQQGLTGPKLVALIIALAIVGSVGLGMVVFLAVDAVKERAQETHDLAGSMTRSIEMLRRSAVDLGRRIGEFTAQIKAA